MDEILSSIRRIIDNNDGPARREPPVMPVFDPPPPQAVNDAGAPPAASPGRPPLSRDELDSFADAIDARAARPPARTADAPVRSQPRDGKYQARFTEDDSRAFARVASALAATTEAAPRRRERPAAASDARQVPPRPAPKPQPAEDAAMLRAVNDQAPDVVPAGIDAPASHARPAGSAAATAPSPASGRRGDAGPAASRTPGTTAPHPAAQALTPLISARAQASVGHSFDALSETLKAKAGRDLADMAEEMLRPMLSDWLDNNLPSIVERLVRTEIERIARGEPRRG